MSSRDARSLDPRGNQEPADMRSHTLKLMALQVVGHLPVNTAEAKKVLAMAEQIVDTFMSSRSHTATN